MRTDEQERSYKKNYYKTPKGIEARRLQNIRNKERWNSNPEYKENRSKTNRAWYYRDHKHTLKLCALSNERNQLKYRAKKYGITVEYYNKIFSEQKGCCAICGVHHSTLLKGLVIDHCHSKNKFRGLLCGKCNVMLRKDLTVEILQNAIEYLKKQV